MDRNLEVLYPTDSEFPVRLVEVDGDWLGVALSPEIVLSMDEI